MEYVLWGLPRGSTDPLDARVLLSNGRTLQDVETVKRVSSLDGWHSFRIQTLNLSKPFDASGAFVGACIAVSELRNTSGTGIPAVTAFSRMEIPSCAA